MKKKIFLKSIKTSILMLVVCLLTLNLLACAVTTAKDPNPKTETPKAETPKTETVIKTMKFFEPGSFDPMMIASNEDRHVIMENLYAGLIGYNSEGVPECNRLAKSYEISPDGLSYTFVLRDNIKFHDGDTCDAEDIKYTFERYGGLDGGKGHAQFSNVKSVDIINEKTVKINLKNREAGFLAKCFYGIMPKHVKDLNKTPVGAGPYKLKEYIAGQLIVFEKFDDYVGDNKSHVNKVEIRPMPDSNAVVMALKSGDLDFAQIFASDIEPLKDEFTIEQNSKNTPATFSLNWKVKPFDDPRVRQAIAYAIDKKEVLERAIYGGGTVVHSGIAPGAGYWFNNALKEKWPYDPNKAKELLKEAGQENLSFTIKTSNAPEDINTSTIIAEQLGRIGVKVEIIKGDFAFWAKEVQTDRNYEASVIGWPGRIDPDETFSKYHSTYVKNYDNWSNAEYDKLIEEARIELDPEKRKEKYFRAQEILAEDICAIFIFDPNRIVAHKPNLKGYKNYPTFFINYSEMYYE